MSGAYAHITLGNLCREKLPQYPKISAESVRAVSSFLEYVELGAISPDYPYLGGENEWADLMHHEGSADFFRNAVALIQTLKGTQRLKFTAWTLGFAAHVANDVTIHPIVNCLVGPYKGNESKHRECEMHQDTHVFQRLNVGDNGVSKHLEQSLALCGDPQDSDRLDPDIAKPWKTLLQKTYPAKFAASAPSIDKWHAGFNTVMSAIRKTNKLLPFARHVTSGLKLNYPERDKLNPKFLIQLKTPRGNQIDYDLLFDQAIHNAMRLWEVVDGAISNKDAAPLKTLASWNLDSGEEVGTNKSVYWGAQA